MADLGVFAALVGLFAVVGIVLGMLAARRLGAWDERRAATERRATADAGTVPAAGRTGGVPATAEAGPVISTGRTGSTPDGEPLENGGETVD